jgi:hypothetical protein
LSQEEHYELLFKLTELQDALRNTEAEILQAIKLQGGLHRQQHAEMTEELRVDIIHEPFSLMENQYETKFSPINDLPAEQAMVESIRSIVEQQLESIRNPPNVPLDSFGQTDSKQPQFAETAGLLATMLLTAMTSGFAAAVVVGRTLSGIEVVPRGTFDVWIQQWKEQKYCQYTCMLWFLDCWHISYCEEEWKRHTLDHFRGIPPKDIQCMTCKTDIRMPWDAWMSHAARHIRAGHEFLPQQSQLLSYQLYIRGIISHDAFQALGYKISSAAAEPLEETGSSSPQRPT